MTAQEWFKEAQYGMMVHWGLYSLLGGEYKGEHSCSYAEWIQSYFRIPVAEYDKLATAFNPIYFNAEEWVLLAKRAGMKYLVITSKHHDGFALFDSRCDGFNVKKATPFGRDVLKELAEACYKHGLKLGLYYSQDLDWHEYHGGGYSADPRLCCGTYWSNNWDFGGAEDKDFDICFRNKIYPQVEEILTGYGDLCLIWFDVPMTLEERHSRAIFDAVKKYQPNCLINSRLGNGAYDYVSLGDNEIPKEIPKNVDPNPDMNYINGFKPTPYGLYETAATLNDSWGFSIHDNNWKSAEVIRKNREHLKSLGINYLLNVGPDALGRIPVAAQKILLDAAK